MGNVLTCCHCQDPIGIFPDDGGRGCTIDGGYKYRGWYVFESRHYCCECWFDTGTAAKASAARQREYET